MTKGKGSGGGSFKDALNRNNRPIPGIKPSTPAKVNPFNLKISKPKFQVLNRNIKGTSGTVTTSHSKSMALRRAALLPELQKHKRSHTSSFIDRRFGEGNRMLSEEDKMQERFARERMRKVAVSSRRKKADLFNLNDHDQDDLTHGGRAISAMDEEDLKEFSGEEEDEGLMSGSGQLGRDIVSRGHFGGFEEGESRDPSIPKTKQDVMKEVIAKSKYYKMERQKIKEENEAMVEDLDESFAALRGNLEIISTEERRKLRKEKDHHHHEEEEEEEADLEEEDDFESLVRDMAFDPRSKPTDRTKTEAEVDKALKERIEARKRAMMARMNPDSGKDNGPDGVEEVAIKKSEDTSSEDEREEAKADSEVVTGSTEMDPQLKRIGEGLAAIMRNFCTSSDVEGADSIYKEIAKFANNQPRTIIQLSRHLRTEIGRLADEFTERCNATGRGAVMPNLITARLGLLVSRLFSCSDFHHLVATPMLLLLSFYLATGRMTKVEHVRRALAVVAVVGEIQGEGKRAVPEALEILYSILALTKGQGTAASLSFSHYFERPLGKGLTEEFFHSAIHPDEPYSLSDLLFKVQPRDLEVAKLLKTAVSLLGKLLNQLRESQYPAFLETARPFYDLLQGEGECPAILLELFNSEGSSRKPLLLQAHKPIALPMLTPDYSLHYSLDSHNQSGQDSDEKSLSRLKAAHKRELKGARRELKRDNSFLAAERLDRIRRDDAEYRSKINRIVGSINNEGASFGFGKSSKKGRK